MELQEWISGSFQETDTDYKIAGQNILYKNDENVNILNIKMVTTFFQEEQKETLKKKNV